MSLIDHTEYAEPFALDPNREDAVGLALSALLPLAAIVILNGLVPATAWPGLGLPLPVWADALLVSLMFPLLGAARWASWQAGDDGRVASWWVVGLIVWFLAFPYVSGHLDPFFAGWLNLVTLLGCIGITARAGRASTAALLWMLPVTLIFGLAAIAGYVFLTNGWSPGFAVTATLLRDER